MWQNSRIVESIYKMRGERVKISFTERRDLLFRVHSILLKPFCQSDNSFGGRGLFSYILIENFKNLLVRNQWTDFNITWQECFFCVPLTRLFKPSDFVKKHSR